MDEISVTFAALGLNLLPPSSATAFIERLAKTEDGTLLPAPTPVDSFDGVSSRLTERQRVDALLDLVNDSELTHDRWKEIEIGVRIKWAAAPTRSISPERREALRAFLNERVTIRERAAVMNRERARKAELRGERANRLPERTTSLSIASANLPKLLNGRVHKSLWFTNAGAAKTVPRIVRRGSAKVLANVTLQGAGGELAVLERVRCDSPETALNYALALVLDNKREFGSLLCRCSADGCGRFWLLPEGKAAGKPARNFCPLHAAESARLSAVQRKRRQRQMERVELNRRKPKSRSNTV